MQINISMSEADVYCILCILPRWSSECEASDLQKLRLSFVGSQSPHVQTVVIQQSHQSGLNVNHINPSPQCIKKKK